VIGALDQVAYVDVQPLDSGIESRRSAICARKMVSFLSKTVIQETLFRFLFHHLLPIRRDSFLLYIPNSPYTTRWTSPSDRTHDQIQERLPPMQSVLHEQLHQETSLLGCRPGKKGSGVGSDNPCSPVNCHGTSHEHNVSTKRSNFEFRKPLISPTGCLLI